MNLQKQINELALRVLDAAIDDDWKEIEEFDGTTFCIITNGTPDGTEVYKYKGYLPSWATHWKPLQSKVSEILKEYSDDR